MPATVFAQLNSLRESGVINMNTQVIGGLKRFGFDAAREWIETNPVSYHESLNHGFEPTKPEKVETIDPQVLQDAIDQPEITARDDATTVREHAILEYLDGIFGLSDAAIEYYTNRLEENNCTYSRRTRAREPIREWCGLSVPTMLSERTVGDCVIW